MVQIKFYLNFKKRDVFMNAAIISTARTPLCKSWKGSFNNTHGATLGGHVVKHAVERAQINMDEIEDVHSVSDIKRHLQNHGVKFE